MKIRKGDKVKVTTGKYRGTIGAVLSVDAKANKVVVEGVNVKKRAIKKSDSNNENYIFVQHPVDASNVRLVDDNGAYVKKRELLKKPEAAPKTAEVKDAAPKAKASRAKKDTKVEKGEKKTKSKSK